MTNSNDAASGRPAGRPRASKSSTPAGQEATGTAPTTPVDRSAAPPNDAASTTTGRAENVITGHSLRALSADERRAMIEAAAYRRAEERGFAPGYEWDDWFAAEREIDARYGADPQRTSR